MSFKDILVHLDGGDGDSRTVAAALALATRFQARLTGMFARNELSSPAIIARQPSGHLKEAAAAAETAFVAECAKAGVASEWLVIPHGGPSDIVMEALFSTHTTDLVVLGQDAASGGHVPNEFAEQLVLQSGRPVMVVPRAHTGTIGTKVAIGWKPGREAARAVHDAMPFIEAAQQVTVIAIGPRGAAPSFLPPVTVTRHIEAHGVSAHTDRLEIEGLGVMDALLSRAYDLECDLLVVGAHGGYVLPLGRGSATRHLMRHASLPMLFSH